jgi:zinc transport system ATP-binding protein
MTGPVIQVRNLCLSLGNNLVLTDVHIDARPGEVHAIIGPNGGGKTSALRSILGQMPHSGDIRIEWSANRSIGYVPQVLEFDRGLPVTVINFMAMACQVTPAFFGLRKFRQEEVRNALARVGLVGKERQMIGSLSGGERQRMLFAQALVPDPALVILDEPMTALDESGVSIFENLIKSLKDQNKTILWVNHDMEQVQRLADVITVIDRDVIASGPTQTTLTESMKHGNFRGDLKRPEEQAA